MNMNYCSIALGLLLAPAGCAAGTEGADEALGSARQAIGQERQAKAIGATSAQATGLPLALVSCIVNETTTYSPPITDTPSESRLTSVSTTGPCISGNLTINSGTLNTINLYKSFSCTDISNGGGKRTVTYNGGRYSTYTNETISVDNVEAALVVTVTGTVTAGEFIGNPVVQTTTLIGLPNPPCALGGSLSSLSGPTTVEILPLPINL